MKQHYLFLGIVLVSLVVSQAWGNAGDVLSKLSFESAVCDLGQVGLSTKHACEFKFTNTGQATLKITNIRSTCGCTAAKLERQEYAPGESGTIKVTYAARSFDSVSNGLNVAGSRVRLLLLWLGLRLGLGFWFVRLA